MNARVAKRKQSRAARAQRRDLVHAAGCIEAGCSARWMFDDDARAEIANEVRDFLDGRRVRVPRSLRRFFGRWL